MTLMVPLTEEELIEELSVLNPMEPWVKPLAYAKMLVFAAQLKIRDIEVTLGFTEWVSKKLETPEARLYIDHLRKIQQLIDEGRGHLGDATQPGNSSQDDDLKHADDRFEEAQHLAKSYRRKSSKSGQALFLPLRARAFRLKGQTAFYRRDMRAARDNYDAAEGILDELDRDGSFGPVTDVKAFALSAEASRARKEGEELPASWANTNEQIRDIAAENDIAEPRWASALARWLKDRDLKWPPGILGWEGYVLRLNRCVYLKALAKYEANWSYYQASIGARDEAARASGLATDLMVEAYFGTTTVDVQTGRNLDWYLRTEPERVDDVQNTAARTMLWPAAAALRDGSDCMAELDVIERLKRRDGSKGTVNESLHKGLENLREVGMSTEAEQLSQMLRTRMLLD